MLYDPLEELRDFKYESVSHTFNRAIIAAYNNVRKNGIVLNDDFISVKQQQRTSIFQLNEKAAITQFPPRTDIYTEFPFSSAKKTTEVCYDLKTYFSSPEKETRRLIRFKEREEVEFRDVFEVDECMPIYDAWVEAKKADPKVFQINFNPDRYKRSYELKSKGFNIYQKMILTNGSPYAIINFSIEGNRAYEISFCSKYYGCGTFGWGCR